MADSDVWGAGARTSHVCEEALVLRGTWYIYSENRALHHLLSSGGGTLAHFTMSYLSKGHQGHLFEHGGTRVGPPPTVSTSDHSRLFFWVKYKDIDSWKIFCQKCILTVFEERLAKYKKWHERPNGKGAGSQNTKAELKKRDPRTKGLQFEGR